MKLDASPLSLIKTIEVATILYSIYYSEVSKLAHSNEAHILLPTFPAGQTEKKNVEEPGSLCDLLRIPCVVVLTEKHAHKAPSNYIGHSKHQRSLQAAELISVLLRRSTCYFSSFLPGTGAVTFPALGWFSFNSSFLLCPEYSF